MKQPAAEEHVDDATRNVRSFIAKHRISKGDLIENGHSGYVYPRW